MKHTDDCLSAAMFLASESYSSSSYGTAECAEDLPVTEEPAILYASNADTNPGRGAEWLSAV